MPRPLVIVPACLDHSGAHASHTAQHKYLHAVVVGAHCMPLMLPALGEAADLDAVLERCDGVMLTGSASNVGAGLYGEAVLDPNLPQDAARDATTLPLIHAVLGRGMPLLAICRGFQELNVALGGTLHQAVHGVAGMQDHRENKQHDLQRQYAPAHRVTLEPGGMLQRLLGGAGDMQVNSLHGQGIAHLAPGLQVEARADDGLVEAVTLAGAPGFVLALQWHPEWQVADHPQSMALFDAFGQACRLYQAQNQAQKYQLQK